MQCILTEAERICLVHALGTRIDVLKRRVPRLVEQGNQESATRQEREMEIAQSLRDKLKLEIEK